MKLSTFLKFFYPTPYKVRNRLRKGKEIRDLDLGGFGDDWLCDQGLDVSLTHERTEQEGLIGGRKGGKEGTYLVDVRQDTTTCDGRADKLVKLFVTSNG